MKENSEEKTAAGAKPSADNNGDWAVRERVADILRTCVAYNITVWDDEPDVETVYKDQLEPVLDMARKWDECPAVLIAAFTFCRAALDSTIDPFIDRVFADVGRGEDKEARKLIEFVCTPTGRPDREAVRLQFNGICSAVLAYARCGYFRPKKVTDAAFRELLRMQSIRMAYMEAITNEGYWQEQIQCETDYGGRTVKAGSARDRKGTAA